MSPTPTPPVYCRNPRRLVWVPTLRPSPETQKLGCREYPFEAHLCGSYVHCDLPVRLHACSPPRLAATQLARSSVLNRLSAPAGLAPALMCALRAHEFREGLRGFAKRWREDFRELWESISERMSEVRRVS